MQEVCVGSLLKTTRQQCWSNLVRIFKNQGEAVGALGVAEAVEAAAVPMVASLRNSIGF